MSKKHAVIHFDVNLVNECQAEYLRGDIDTLVQITSLELAGDYATFPEAVSVTLDGEGDECDHCRAAKRPDA